MEGDLDHLSVSRGMILDLFQSAKVLRVMVTKPVWFKGGGLREVLKTCLRRSGYEQAGQQRNRMTKRASLPLP